MMGKNLMKPHRKRAEEDRNEGITKQPETKKNGDKYKSRNNYF